GGNGTVGELGARLLPRFPSGRNCTGARVYGGVLLGSGLSPPTPLPGGERGEGRRRDSPRHQHSISYHVCGGTMKRNTDIRKIAFIGDYIPRRCGIATFTHDLCEAVVTQYPSAQSFIVSVNDTVEGYEYPGEVRFEIPEQELESYLRAADFLNFSNADVVCL